MVRLRLLVAGGWLLVGGLVFLSMHCILRDEGEVWCFFVLGWLFFVEVSFFLMDCWCGIFG